MRILDWQPARLLKHWLGWVLRPRHSYRRLKELQRVKNAPDVRDDLGTDGLPPATVELAASREELRLVVDLYKRNPTTMNIAPRSMEAMDRMRDRNVEFYRIFDAEGIWVGNIGYQVERRILGYLQIDFAIRSRGLGMAAMLAAEQAVHRRHGIEVVYGQVLRNNKRMLTTVLSTGWEVDEQLSTPEYFTIAKRLGDNGNGNPVAPQT